MKSSRKAIIALIAMLVGLSPYPVVPQNLQVVDVATASSAQRTGSEGGHEHLGPVLASRTAGIGLDSTLVSELRYQLARSGGSGVNVSSVQGDDAWDRRFNTNLPSGPVHTLLVSGTHLFVGGEFRFAGAVVVNNIARWDGSTWTALGTGTNAKVLALARFGNDIYAGGQFTSVGGQTIRGLARWNGSSWSPVGNAAQGFDVNGSVAALDVNGGILTLGGSFNAVGQIAAANVARWDGANWSLLGSGTTGPVKALASSGSTLFTGGSFASAGGVTTGPVAQWNGTAWSSLGLGITGTVNALLVAGTDLFAGGDSMTRIGNITIGSGGPDTVARWDGSVWSRLGTGAKGQVHDLALAPGGIHLAGFVSSVNGTAVSGLVHWDGANAIQVGNSFANVGVVAPIRAIATLGTAIHLGGDFVERSPRRDYLTRLEGTGWTWPFGDGLAGFASVSDVWATPGGLFVAGSFIGAGDQEGQGVARWDGSDWTAFPPPPVAIYGTVAVSGTNVFLGGSRSPSGGLIAKWDGVSWTELATDLDGAVRDITIIGNDVFVGGTFTIIGGVLGNRIARWNGTTWSALGTGISNGEVNSVAVDGNALVVAGLFSQAGGVPANNIARWTGTTWQALAGGLPGRRVNALLVTGSEVLAAGFGNGSTYGTVSRWNGSAWSAIGAGDVQFSASSACNPNGSTCGSVKAIARNGSDIIIGGFFAVVDGVAASNIARFNGEEWSPLGSGADLSVFALVSFAGALYSGGLFKSAGGGFSNGLARWTPTSDLGISVTAPPSVETNRAVTYTITVLNNGTVMATNTVLTATLGPGAVFAGASTGCQRTGQQVTCTVGDVAGGSSKVRRISVVPVVAGDLVSTFGVQSSLIDTQPGNNIVARALTVVGAANPVPTLVSISPAAVVQGSNGAGIALAGSNFVPGSLVLINGAARPAIFISPGVLAAPITAPEMQTAGPRLVNVLNLAPGGGSSNAVVVTVLPNNVGTNLFSPDTGSGPANVARTFTLTWTHPITWRAITTLDIRARTDDGTIAFWARFTEHPENASLMSFLTPDGIAVGEGSLGAAILLETSSSILDLGRSAMSTSERDLVLRLSIQFGEVLKGQTLHWEVFGEDDDLQLQGPDFQGSWRVNAAELALPGIRKD